MMFQIVRRHLIAAALPLLLTGCASIVPGTTPPEARPTARRYQESVNLDGRLSVRYQGAQKEEALHGNFTWIQTPARTTVTLLSPLGQTIAVIDVTQHGATLTQSGQSVRTAMDVNTLTANELGWPLPVAGLRDWLQGFGTDSTGQRFVATSGASDITTSDGWHVRYDNWQEGTHNRPKRIDLQRNTKQAGDVSIRIVIDSWQER